MNKNILTGQSGELIAKEYLVNKGLIILETNYRNKIGEIDIIAMDEQVLVFIEVKTRRDYSYGYAFEAVNIKKQRKFLIWWEYLNDISCYSKHSCGEIHTIPCVSH